MTVRAKFRVDSVQRTKHGVIETHTIKLRAVASDSPENAEFWYWTPSGEIVLQCINPDVAAELDLGEEFYVDFTRAST